jgi:hypothetical protein
MNSHDIAAKIEQIMAPAPMSNNKNLQNIASKEEMSDSMEFVLTTIIVSSDTHRPK